MPTEKLIVLAERAAEEGESARQAGETVYRWIAQRVSAPRCEEITKLLREARFSSPTAYRYLVRCVRYVAGRQYLEEGTSSHLLILMSAPLTFVAEEPVQDAFRFRSVGARQQLERAFEFAAGLPTLSFRFARFPVAVPNLVVLSPHQLRKLAHDLNSIGDSKLLSSRVLDLSAQERRPVFSAHWPGILALDPEQDRVPLFDRMAPSIKDWCQLAESSLVQEMGRRLAAGWKVFCSPPLPLQDAMSQGRYTTNAVRLRLASQRFSGANRAQLVQVTPELYELHFLDEKGSALGALDLDFPEEDSREVARFVSGVLKQSNISVASGHRNPSGSDSLLFGKSS